MLRDFLVGLFRTKVIVEHEQRHSVGDYNSFFTDVVMNVWKHLWLLYAKNGNSVDKDARNKL